MLKEKLFNDDTLFIASLMQHFCFILARGSSVVLCETSHKQCIITSNCQLYCQKSFSPKEYYCLPVIIMHGFYKSVHLNNYHAVKKGKP